MSEYRVKAILSADGTELVRTMEKAGDSVEALARTGEKSTAAFSAAFTATQKVVSAVMSSITGSIGKAVSRFDTLNRFPKIMEQLGFAADDTADSLERMSKGIEGLPTTMDEIVRSAQQIALINNDISKATDIAIAFNDAMYASGATSADASRGLVQFTQMLSAGKVDMMSWRTLLETMPLALNQVAESFGFVGTTAKNDLYAALRDGTVTFDEFAAKIVELDNGVNGFAELARTASGGIATSFQNIHTAVVKGLANTLQAIDAGLTSAGLPKMEEALNSFKTVINNAFNAANSVIQKVVTAIAPVLKFLKDNIKTVKVVVEGLVTALIGLKIGEKVKGWMDKMAQSHRDAKVKIEALKEATKKYGGTMGDLKPRIAAVEEAEKRLKAAVEKQRAALKAQNDALNGEKVDLVAAAKAKEDYENATVEARAAQEDLTGAQQVQNTQLSLGQVLYGVLTHQMTLTEAKQYALNRAMSANPIGLIITAVTTLITALRALDTVMEKLVPEYAELKEFAEEQKKVWDGVKESKTALNEFKTGLEASALAMEKQNEQTDQLIRQIYTMAEGEEKATAAGHENEKTREQIAEKTDKLNSILGESVLIYDKETNSLNLDRKSMEKYQKQREKQQRLAWIDEQLAAAQDDLAEATNNAAGASVMASKEMGRSENAYKKTMSALDITNDAFDANVAAYMDAGTAATLWSSYTVEANEKTLESERAYKENVEEYEKVIEDLYKQRGEAEADLAAAEAEYVEEYKASLKEMLDAGTATYDMLSETNQQLVDDLRGKYQDYVEAATEMFDKLPSVAEHSLDELAENLNYNSTMVGIWAQNIADLREFFAGNDVVQPLIDHFAEMGPEAAPYIQQMIDAVRNGDTSLIEQMAEDFAAVQPAAVTWLEQATGSDIPEAVEKMVSSTKTSLSEAIRSADWAEAGADIVEGFATEGIMGNIGTAETAGAQLGEATYDAEASADERHSPSRKYERAGKDNVQGFVNGYKAMQPTAISTAQSLGVQVMLGFEKGLNQAANRVYNTAQAIADTVARTVQKALDMHSPSKVMERLGWNTGAGFAGGVESTEGLIARASESLAEKARSVIIGDYAGLSGMYSRPALSFAGEASVDASGIGDAIAGALGTRPIVVETVMNVDGRAFAKAVTPAVTEEQENAAQFNNMRRGVK